MHLIVHYGDTMNQAQIKSLPFVEKAKTIIFSRRDLLMSIRRSAWWLFRHELDRVDPATGRLYTPRRALKNTLRWMDEQATFLERIKQEPTQLQKRLLQMLVDGHSQKQIALQLGISERTINTHFSRFRISVGAKTVYQALAFSVSRGWVKVSRPDRAKRGKPI